MYAFPFDLRHALRGLRRDSAFTLRAMVTLAVTLSLNVVVFTVRDAMVFRGLPLAERSDRLLYIGMRKPSDMACCPGPVNYADFEAWRAESHAFVGLAFGRRSEPITFRADTGRPIDMTVSRHTTNMFGVLGVQPIVGRDFVAADGAPGAPGVAIISHEFWERRLNKRTDIIGLPVSINTMAASIVGVLPERFAIVYPQDIFLPLATTTAGEGGVIGRLRDGATQEEARAELDAITRGLPPPDPVTTRGTPSVATYTQAHVGPDAPQIYGSLWAGAWFVLLIACANLANLKLLRTIGRWREFSTRIALGEGVMRVARRMLIESAVLATVAAVPAWWIVEWSVQTWADATASRYLVLDYSVTTGTAAYLISIALVAAILIALLPISSVMRFGTNEALKGQTRGVTPGRHSKRLTASLVAGQMALAIVLLLGAGVLVRSFQNIVGADTGVRDAERITAGLVGLPSDKYPTPQARAELFGRLAAKLRTIAGTQEVALASTIPTRGARLRSIEIDGRPNALATAESAQVVTISANYFRTMGRPTIAGRDFNEVDDLSSTLVVIVNDSFAAAYWPDDQALGKRLRLIDGGVAGPWRTVVGVSANVMQGAPTRQSFKAVLYVPLKQQPSARVFVFVRANAPPGQMTQTVLGEVNRLDPDFITEDFSSLQTKLAFDRDWMDLEHADLGKHAAIAPVFAAVALVLATMGLVAVIAHSVSQRTKEIGVRMAVGAGSHDIAQMIIREGMRPVAIGMVAGLVAAAGANRLLESQLLGLSPYDPITMAAGPLVLVVVALAGCKIPARRAMQVDPVIALRHE